MQVKSRSGRVFDLPNKAQDRAIRAGIAADPDTREIGSDELVRLRPLRGRPRASVKRPMLSMRTDPDILAHLRASGKGWQTKVNALLREAVEKGRV